MKEINATKQKILIGGFIIIIILAIVMIGVMFFKKDKKVVQSINNSKTQNKDKQKNENVKTVDQGNNTRPKNNNSNKSKFLKLTSDNVTGLKIKKGTNQAIFFQKQNILTVDPFSGKKHAIGSYPFKEVKKFLWAKNVNKAIINDSGEYYIYNLENNTVNKFKDKIDIAIWNATDNKIIYKYYNSKTHKRKIRVSDLQSGDNKVLVDNLPYRKVDLILQPNTDRFCYFPTPDARVKGKLFCLDSNGSNKKEYGGRYGQNYLWSPNGNKILTSFTKENTGSSLVLGVMNKNGGEAKGLSFGTTVKKCVWSKNNVDIYCAMVVGAKDNSILPNDWRDKEFYSKDTFWKINTDTGKKKRLTELKDIIEELDTASLIIDPEEEFLFFINRKNGDLWRLKL